MEHEQAFSPVHEAIIKGDMQALTKILESPCDLEERSRSMTALQSAAHHGYFTMLPILLAYGAKLNAAAGEFGCALQAVISSVRLEGQPDLLKFKRQGHEEHIIQKRNAQEEAIRLLLQDGAHVDASGGEFGNPLAAAAAFGERHIVTCLLENGANPNAPGGRLGCALQAASAHGDMPMGWCVNSAVADDYDRVQDMLLHAGSRVNHVGGIYGSALQAASFLGNKTLVSKLLFHGADPNIKAGKYVSALDAAMNQQHTKVVECLLEAGARPQGNNARSRHADDDWQSWRDEPVSSLFLLYGRSLPSARVEIDCK